MDRFRVPAPASEGLETENAAGRDGIVNGFVQGKEEYTSDKLQLSAQIDDVRQKMEMLHESTNARRNRLSGAAGDASARSANTVSKAIESVTEVREDRGPKNLFHYA